MPSNEALQVGDFKHLKEVSILAACSSYLGYILMARTYYQVKFRLLDSGTFAYWLPAGSVG